MPSENQNGKVPRMVFEGYSGHEHEIESKDGWENHKHPHEQDSQKERRKESIKW